VIVNIGAMSEADAKRMLDFMIGLKEGLEGGLRRVTSKVFLLSPHNVAVTDADSDESEQEDLMQ
jgi:cell division inhibitor SepF